MELGGLELLGILLLSGLGRNLLIDGSYTSMSAPAVYTVSVNRFLTELGVHCRSCPFALFPKGSGDGA